MKAVKRFDPDQGVRLVSFAVHWVRAEMHEFILRNWRIVKVATTKAQRKLFFNLRRNKKRLGWMTAAERTAVAKDLNVSEREVMEMESRLSGRDVGFDAPSDEDDDHAPPSPAAYLVARDEDPSQAYEREDSEDNQLSLLREGLAKLDQRSRDIIARRWLDADSKVTLQELADEYGVSAERIRQIEANALKKMKALFAARETEQFLFGAYFGISVLLALVAVFNAVGFRDRVFAIYAVYLVTFTLGQAAYMGVGAQHLWDPWLTFNAQSTFVLPALSAPAALWFVQRVTEPARFSRRLNQLVGVLIGVLLAVAVVELLMPSRGILSVRLVLTAVSLALVVVLIGLVWTKGDDPDIRIIALGFVPVLVMALFPILRGINVIPNSIFTRYGLAMGAAVEMPILFYALSRRGSRRREAQLRASALPRTDALTGLADRRSLLQRLEAALARARNQRHPCALVVAKLANYDAIAARHGRDTLDRALVVTASHLRRAAADVDLAARAGEREFALLIEGPTTADQASSGLR